MRNDVTDDRKMNDGRKGWWQEMRNAMIDDWKINDGSKGWWQKMRNEMIDDWKMNDGRKMRELNDGWQEMPDGRKLMIWNEEMKWVKWQLTGMKYNWKEMMTGMRMADMKILNLRGAQVWYAFVHNFVKQCTCSNSESWNFDKKIWRLEHFE